MTTDTIGSDSIFSILSPGREGSFFLTQFEKKINLRGLCLTQLGHFNESGEQNARIQQLDMERIPGRTEGRRGPVRAQYRHYLNRTGTIVGEAVLQMRSILFPK